jgi:hypothetical protein
MDAHAVPSAGDWALDRNGAIFLQGACVRQLAAYRRAAARTHSTARDLRMCSHVAADAMQRSAAQHSAMQCNGRDALQPGETIRTTSAPGLGLNCRAAGTERALFDSCAFDRLDGNAVMVSGHESPPLPLTPYTPYTPYPEALNARTACPHLASFLATAAGPERACRKQTRSADT